MGLRLLLALAVALSFAAFPAQAQSPREQLAQMVQQLQANPGDSGLRERIIKLAQEIKPPPAIPEEARQHFVEGTTIAKSATNATQQRLAVDSFNRALRLAPWWGDAYYNLGVVQELAGDLDGAQSSFRFYILTNPGAKEAREAQDRIYALNAKKKLATAEQNGPAGIGDSERKFLQSLEGAVWVGEVLELPLATGMTYRRYGYSVRSGRLIGGLGPKWSPGMAEPWFVLNEQTVEHSFPLTGKRMTVNWGGGAQCNPYTVQISDDGHSLTSTSAVNSNCRGRTDSYTRIR